MFYSVIVFAGNVAYKKDAKKYVSIETEGMRNSIPSQAVDGNIKNCYYSRYLTSPEWWMVDFGALSVVYNVTIYASKGTYVFATLLL